MHPAWKVLGAWPHPQEAWPHPWGAWPRPRGPGHTLRKPGHTLGEPGHTLGGLATPSAVGIVLLLPEPESEMLQQRRPDRWLSRWQLVVPSATQARYPCLGMALPRHSVHWRAACWRGSTRPSSFWFPPPGPIQATWGLFRKWLHFCSTSSCPQSGDLEGTVSFPQLNHLGFRCGPQSSAAGFLFGKAAPDAGSSSFSADTCAFDKCYVFRPRSQAMPVRTPS